jgi:hypothetical protein
MGKVYRGSFVNTQVDYSDNSPNEQTFYVRITDLATTGIPYDFDFYIDDSIGGGDQLMYVSWVGLPIDTTQLIIGYSLADQENYTNITINNPNATDTYSWTAPFGNYDIKLQVVRSAGPTEVYYIYYDEVTLELADAPVVLQTVDNSEDKFTPIKSKSCTLRIFTSDTIDISNFASGGDTQFKVEVAINQQDAVIYTGWLSLSDLSQTFQPDPNIFELIATDGIAFLKKVPLTDNEGRFISQSHSLIKYISWCLRKTGFDLPIWIEMNLLQEGATYDSPFSHFYNSVYLNAQTFDDDVDTLEDCYSVLEKILGEFCDLSQQKNVWYIRSTDEAEYATKRICKFTYDGEPVNYDNILLAKDIGSDSNIYTMAFMNDDARLSLERPCKYVQNEYNYNQLPAIVDNIGFDKGEYLVSPDLSAPTSQGIIRPQGWTHIRAIDDAPITTDIAQTIQVYEYGYLKDTYLELKQASPIGPTLYINNVRSTPVQVQQNDRITISVQVRTSASINAIRPIQVRLTGVSGTTYDWQLDATTLNSAGEPTINQWNSVDPTAFSWYTWLINNNIAEVNSVTHTITVPEAGTLYVRLLNATYQISLLYFSSDTWFTELDIKIDPLINGSYNTYNGQRHTSEQDINTLNKRESEVYMSDSPHILFKGAMLSRSLGSTIFSGSAEFDNLGSVVLSGFHSMNFYLNQYIEISNTTFNNGTYRVVGVTYNKSSAVTIIEFAEDTITETVGGALMKQYNFNLASRFYDSIQYPIGNPVGSIVGRSPVGNLAIVQGPITATVIQGTFDVTINSVTYNNVTGSMIYGVYFFTEGGGPQQIGTLVTQVSGNLDTYLDIATQTTGTIILGTPVSGDYPVEGLFPYGQHQNQAVWNQYNRVFNAFEATIDGLDTDQVDAFGLPDLPDLLHVYRQNDAHPATTNKIFKTLHYEQDTDNCEWSIYMVEVYDSTIPKTYDGHSFKYIQK